MPNSHKIPKILKRLKTDVLKKCVCVYVLHCALAGWSGWGCTDDSSALSYGRQVLATLLLTLSNLAFLPAIVVAASRCYITEASVYTFTMFFSTVNAAATSCTLTC